MNTTLYNIRKNIVIFLYSHSLSLYTRWFKQKQQAWNITPFNLLHYPTGSLGRQLGEFYQHHGFSIMPKLENHDVFHILTETDTNVEDEIALQYLLLGNGKISLYLLGALSLGIIMFPEYFSYFYSHYKKGKQMEPFYNINFEILLDSNFSDIQLQLYTQTLIYTLQ